ncbi:MAG: hypothetical protein HQL18_02535, partial [Candidatus Omnitrophica bacterium]|nr:hypothetical protein [Candidatus Omnitrophota bacterium]
TVSPDALSLVAQTGGIITGLDQGKKEYQAGDVIFTLGSPELVRQREDLVQQLRIEEGRLASLKALQERKATTTLEVAPVEEKVLKLRQQLVHLEQESAVQVFRAPCDLSIKEILISNGMTVNKGATTLNYFDSQRVRFTVEMPLTQ